MNGYGSTNDNKTNHSDALLQKTSIGTSNNTTTAKKKDIIENDSGSR
ncbi:unnamed protein product, partial [Rotaria magnacalcarata]